MSRVYAGEGPPLAVNPVDVPRTSPPRRPKAERTAEGIRLGRQAAFWLGILALTVFLLYTLRSVLLPFVAGMGIAYFCDPIADRIERVGAPRWLATTLVLLGFALAIALVLVLILPVLQQQIGQAIKAVPGYVDQLRTEMLPRLMTWLDQVSPGASDQLKETAGSYAGKVVGWAGALLGGIWASGVAIVDLLSLLFVMPLVAFYLLRDWDRMMADVDALLPREHAPTIRQLAREVDSTLSGFVRGQATLCLIQAAYYAIGLSIVGLNFGLIIGLGAGFLTFIPFIGSASGFIVAMLVAVTQYSDWGHIGAVIGIFAMGQVLENNVLTPWLIGSSIRLHPVWVIFALLAGGAVFGFLGVLLAVPVAAVMGVLIRFAISVYEHSRLYRGDGDPAGQDPGI